jgi:hypothetical protein
MPEYVAIKLKNGEDIVAVLTHDEQEFITIENPVSIDVDPEHGFFAKAWNFLARSDMVALSKDDILLFDDASEKAIYYYEEFMRQHEPQKEKTLREYVEDTEYMSELEEMFNAVLENKTSTKH